MLLVLMLINFFASSLNYTGWWWCR